MRSFSQPMPWRIAWAILACGLLQSAARAAEPTILVPAGTEWRLLRGTSEPTPPGTPPGAWREPGFDRENTWPVAVAPFWYGESARFGGTGRLMADMLNRYSSFYLRRTFHVPNPGAFASLRLRAMVDDGFIAWINGVRVASLRAPAGEPGRDSVAAANAPEPVDFETFNLPSPAALLRPGTNVLAVQVFNVSLSSSDIVFDAELAAVPHPPGPPLVAQVTPPPGVVEALDSITVTFSESVRGVRAEDLLINGSSATGIEGSNGVYTFRFPAPELGSVAVSWNPFHEITDLDDPPNRFDASVPGSTWVYEVIDPDAPAVVQRQPPAGSTVRALTQVEVRFSMAVTGVDAADLLRNDRPAVAVSGVGAGPYRFTFDAPVEAGGPARISWRPDHGIVSDSPEPRALASSGWTYVVDPDARPAPLVITEFMAENFTAFRDEEQDPEDWIEIHNPTANSVNLEGWSLSDDPDEPGLWTFPAIDLPANGRIVVFASGKDRRTPPGPLHTNFKLNANGDFIGLYPPELPRRAVDEIAFPRQGPDHSYGRELDSGAWRYFSPSTSTPGAPNPASGIVSAVEEVQFSVERGFFAHPFNLILSTRTPGATIRYTMDGSPPTETSGFLYTNPVRIATNRVIRAAAFRSNALPSRVLTHTYLLNPSPGLRRLPVLSLVTATNHLYGPSGIMEISPRNTTKRGAAWERPVSVEYIRVEDNSGFQVDCGLRIQGGNYVRERYNYRSSALPFSKYSFRLYFRGEYGEGRLEYPLFPGTTQQSFDTIVLRAGMNDHSNPFILDEFVRNLARDTGQPAALGTFVHLFLNGEYKGYYNPTERIDPDFLRAYHGGGEDWDIMAQGGEVREGDLAAWNALGSAAGRNLAIPENYRDLAARLDLTNFVDYLCPLIYADNDDWPHNNWRAARERVPDGLYRFYAWDCEWSFGNINNHPPSWNTIQNQLAPGGHRIQTLFNNLRRSPEFRLFFADRVHRHFFNDGALTDARIRARYAEVTNRLNGVIAAFDDRVGRTWIPHRRRYVLQHLAQAGLLASSNAPALNRHGGIVPPGFTLSMTNLRGTIHYTTNGIDPRVAFTGEVSPDARTYSVPIRLDHSLVLRARSLDGTNWSALTEAVFEVNEPRRPVRITELMYRPAGGDAFEFIEIANLGSVPVDLSGYSFRGVDFRFPEPSPLMPPGARWVIASDAGPAQFMARYPDVVVAGWFDAALNNTSERIELVAPDGTVVDAVEYFNSPPWPQAANGGGPSLVLIDPDADPRDPAAWIASPEPAGSPGQPGALPALPVLRLSEVAPLVSNGPDWLELENAGDSPIDLAGWSLSDNSNPRRFVFPPGAAIAPGAFLRILCDSDAPASSGNTGFGLSRDGETLALYDPAGERVDAITFGFVPAGFTLARFEDSWDLGQPTPEAPNQRAPLAAPPSVALNEWLVNPPSGGDDWLELHNRDPILPAALRGMVVSTRSASHQIGTHTFIPPGGFLVLIADEASGPANLGIRFPAAGGVITLSDRFGAPIDSVSYPETPEGLTRGRLPDGEGEPRAFPGSPSPGLSNHVAPETGPFIHEWLARNHGVTPHPEGGSPDWIELHNPAATSVDLSRAILTIEPGASWTFPQGVQIAANGYLLVWCDPARPASVDASGPLNTGVGLPDNGATLRLATSAGRLLHMVTYGPQLIDRSSGRVGSSVALLAAPTPGLPNALPAPLGAARQVLFNEWLAGAPDNADWIEIFNPDDRPVDLAGHFITDDPSIAGSTKAVLPPVTLIGPRGHIVLHADSNPAAGPDHLPFSLDADGESLWIYTPSGALAASADVPPARTATAHGRFPDGASAFTDFPASASPGGPNWLPHPAIVINEVLARASPPLEPAIELHNLSPRRIDLSGWWLSTDDSNLAQARVPDTLSLAPGGFHVLYAGGPAAVHAELDLTHAPRLWLSEADDSGNLTGYRALAVLHPLESGVSVGRHRTSIGWDDAPLSRRTFGIDDPASVDEFRTGAGAANAYPRVGPVILSEIHFKPLAATAPDAPELPDHEFLEVRNTGFDPVALGADSARPGWRIRGGVQYDFPSGFSLQPDAFAVIVAFNPANASATANFRAAFDIPADVPILGPFSGRLSNDGEEIRLERPDPQPPAGTPGRHVLVERVVFGTAFPWPDAAGAPNHSLQRTRAAEYSNDPAHWMLAGPSPGRPIAPPASDRDLDGMPNDWEIAHGLDPDDPSDAHADADGDSLSNLAEYLAGTDPRDPRSALALRLEFHESAGPVLTFDAVAHRSYSILARDDARLGAWETAFTAPAEPFDRQIILPITYPDAHGRARFFQVVTPARP